MIALQVNRDREVVGRVKQTKKKGWKAKTAVGSRRIETFLFIYLFTCGPYIHFLQCSFNYTHTVGPLSSLSLPDNIKRKHGPD